MTFTIPDDLSIPEFLQRPMTADYVSPVVRENKKRGKIPYPKDGYACKGERKEAREKHKTRLQRKAEKMRQPIVRKRKRSRK